MPVSILHSTVSEAVGMAVALAATAVLVVAFELAIQLVIGVAVPDFTGFVQDDPVVLQVGISEALVVAPGYLMPIEGHFSGRLAQIFNCPFVAFVEPARAVELASAVAAMAFREVTDPKGESANPNLHFCSRWVISEKGQALSHSSAVCLPFFTRLALHLARFSFDCEQSQEFISLLHHC